MFEDRRRIRQETLTQWPAEDTERGEDIGVVTNITDEGLQLLGEREFSEGETFLMQMKVDSRMVGADSISFMVENVWCSSNSRSDSYRAGFKIVHMSEMAKRGLKNLFSSFSYASPTRPEDRGQNPGMSDRSGDPVE
jgi:hypothetical protein